MKKKSTLLAVSLFSMAIFACTSKNKTEIVGESAVQTDAEKVAETRGAHVVSKITFDKGRTDLNEGAKKEITNAITEAQKIGDIDDVSVAVWSDMAYPGKNGKKLPNAQVGLAETRGEKIENFISKDLNVSSVSVHNMGKKPSFLAEYLNTADNNLKTDLIAKGVTEKEGELNMNSAVSSALIFIKLK